MPNSSIEIGAGALFDYDGIGHVAVITELGPTKFKVIEGNKIPCEIDERWIDYNDKFIRGFYK